MRSRVVFSHLFAFAFALVAVVFYPTIARRVESARLAQRLSRLAPGISDSRDGAAAPLIGFDPGLLVRVDELEGLVASWQTIGGCGAGAGAASSAGLKWVGRNVTGGLFNVQEQVSYSNIGNPQYPEHNFFVNTFINADVTEKWNFGVIVPLVYKYLDDPLHLAPDVPAVNYSNGKTHSSATASPPGAWSSIRRWIRCGGSSCSAASRRGAAAKTSSTVTGPQPLACMGTLAIFWVPSSRPSVSCCLDTRATISIGTPSRPRRSQVWRRRPGSNGRATGSR